MNGAALFGRIFALTEKRRVIQEPCFVVSADANGNTAALHFREDFVRNSVHCRGAPVRAQEGAAYAQVKDHEGSGPKIHIKDGRRFATYLHKRFLQHGGVRKGLESTRFAKRTMRKSWMNLCPARECLPRWRLGDRYVGIVWLDRRPLR